jgi:hypothetical protein
VIWLTSTDGIQLLPGAIPCCNGFQVDFAVSRIVKARDVASYLYAHIQARDADLNTRISDPIQWLQGRIALETRRGEVRDEDSLPEDNNQLDAGDHEEKPTCNSYIFDHYHSLLNCGCGCFLIVVRACDTVWWSRVLLILWMMIVQSIVAFTSIYSR